MNLPPQIEDTEVLPAEVAQAVKALWVDSGVQEAYGRKKEFQLNDSAK